MAPKQLVIRALNFKEVERVLLEVEHEVIGIESDSKLLKIIMPLVAYDINIFKFSYLKV